MKTQHVQGILDRSGSMKGKTEDVIGGFKTNVEELQKSIDDDYNVFVSAKMFDIDEDIILESTDVKTLTMEKIDKAMEKYIPRSQTAIRDSIGSSLTYFITKYESGEKFDSCVIYIFTDGIENASTKFSSSEIRSLIEKGETMNIKVIYVGSNQDAILNAGNFGIAPGHSLNYTETPVNVTGAYRALSGITKRARSGGHVEFSLPERTASQASPPPVDLASGNEQAHSLSLSPPKIARSVGHEIA
jgi:hypothetical protein